MAHRLASAFFFFPLPFLHFHNWMSAFEQSMLHRIRAKDFILKVHLELLVFSSRARLTQHLATPTSQTARGEESPLYVGWSEATKRTKTGICAGGDAKEPRIPRPRPPRPLCSLAGQDERTLEDWTLWTTRTAARGGGRDLVERSWLFSVAVPESKTLAFKSWGGDLWLCFFRCRQTALQALEREDLKVVLWVFVKFTGD